VVGEQIIGLGTSLAVLAVLVASARSDPGEGLPMTVGSRR